MGFRMGCMCDSREGAYIYESWCVHVCVCVCVYVCVCMCVYACVWVFVYVQILYVYVYIHTYMCIHVHMYIFTHIDIHILICMHICTYQYLRVYIYLYTKNVYTAVVLNQKHDIQSIINFPRNLKKAFQTFSVSSPEACSTRCWAFASSSFCLSSTLASISC